AGILRLLARATADMQGQARAGRSTWTLLELEFVLYAFRDAGTRAKLAQHYRELRSRAEPLTSGPDQTWLLQALGLGIAILACVDPEATPPGIGKQPAPPLLGAHQI